jgi:hypothetical protein
MPPTAKLEGPIFRYLTKSLMKTALKCPKKLVYATHPALFPQSRDHVEDPLYQHLSMEGKRFGEYCKRLFPHGMELRDLEYGQNDFASTVHRLSSETHRNLMGGHDGINQKKRVTVFEGVVCHGAFYAQPDILDKIVHDDDVGDGRKGSQRTELRVIEVKSKSWDSRYSVEDKMLSKSKKQPSVKANYLPYIQDVAFQSMVCRMLYSQEHDVRVSSWLMMPDRSKIMKCNMSDTHDERIPQHSTLFNNIPINDRMPTLDDTIQTIDNSIATLINVDELVEIALNSEVSYPGSTGDTLQEIVYRWAEEVNSPSFGPQSFPTPIGMQCSSCEYRIKDIPTSGTHSGFHHCWQEATGYDLETLRANPLIVDLYGNTKKQVTTFLSKDKYTLSELSTDFFELAENGTPAKKAGMGESITNHQRQWYQVETTKRLESIPSANEVNSTFRPRCVIKKNRLDQIMKSWKYPLHFIDFETITPVIPLYSSMSPYEIFAFQFSHHILHESSSTAEHASEFLHTEEGSPNVSFLRALHLAVCTNNDGGTVFQWSPHEHNVLKVMLSSPDAINLLTPREYSDLSALLENGMVDLCKLAQKYYYVDGSGGSSSIKRLLRPTLDASPHIKELYGSPTYNSRNFTNFQWYQLDGNRAKDPYDILSTMNDMNDDDNYNQQQPHQQTHDKANVTKGGAAAAAFQELRNNASLSTKDRRDIEKSLLRYCELDTLAMVMIVQAWQSLLKSSSG